MMSFSSVDKWCYFTDIAEKALTRGIDVMKLLEEIA